VTGMARARAEPGQAASRPMAATPGASPPLNASVLSMVAGLDGHDLKALPETFDRSRREVPSENRRIVC